MTMRMLGMTLTALLWMAGSVDAHAGTVTYVYTDPQGTPLAEADASGDITARFEYTPYGVPVASMGAAPDGVGYTGHVNDPETGLVYMQARYYDAEVGRFLSVDPVGPQEGNLSRLNRYSYADNNPVMHLDPTGAFSKNMSSDQIRCEVYHCESDSSATDGYSMQAAPSASPQSPMSAENGSADVATGQQNADDALQEFLILLRGGKLPQAYNFAKKLTYSVVYNDKVGPRRSELGGGPEGGHSRYVGTSSYRIDLFKGSVSTVRIAFQVIAHEILHGEPGFWRFYNSVIIYQTDKAIRREQLEMLHGQMQPDIRRAINAFDADYIPTLAPVEVKE